MSRFLLAMSGFGLLLVPAANATCQELLYQKTGHVLGAAALSPDGNFLALALCNDTDSVVIWEMPTGKEFKFLREHSNSIQLMWWAPDAATLLVVNMSNGREAKPDTLIVTSWNVAARKDKRLWELPDAGGARAVSPDGKLLVSVCRNSPDIAQVWNLETGKHVAKLKSDEGFPHVVFSGDGKVLVTVGGRHTIKVWDTAKFEEQRGFKGHEDLRRVVVSPRGDMVISQNGPKNAELWDLSGKEVKRVEMARSWFVRFAFSSDGKLLAGNDDGKLRLWDVPSLKLVAEVPIKKMGSQFMMFSPDDRTVALCALDGTVALVAIPEPKKEPANK